MQNSNRAASSLYESYLEDPKLRLFHQQSKAIEVVLDLFVRLHVAVADEELHLGNNQGRK